MDATGSGGAPYRPQPHWLPYRLNPPPALPTNPHFVPGVRLDGEHSGELRGWFPHRELLRLVDCGF